MYVVDNGLSTQGHMYVLDNGQFECLPLKGTPELYDLQQAVKGPIEMIPYFETYEGVPCMAFCNEDGKRDGMAYNDPANKAWRISHKARKGKVSKSQYIVGPVVIITGNKDLLETL